ncbi:MAG: carbon storage regulator [Planctomycetales bacterium]
MLVLSREIGTSIVIEDVRVTLVRVGPEHCEVALEKLAGGTRRIATLPRDESVEVCYGARLVFIGASGTKARLAIDAPREVHVARHEIREGLAD